MSEPYFCLMLSSGGSVRMSRMDGKDGKDRVELLASLGGHFAPSNRDGTEGKWEEGVDTVQQCRFESMKAWSVEILAL